jgi:predicted transcriptional regulator
LVEHLPIPRERVLALLEREPGLHLREIPRRAGLSLNAVRYHLVKLEQEGVVVAYRTGHFLRWFLCQDLSPGDLALISALRVRGQRRVLESLLAQGPCRFSSLEALTDLSPNSLAWYLRQLLREGLVALGDDSRYKLSDPHSVRLQLSTYRQRFPDLLADAAREIFGEIE